MFSMLAFIDKKFISLAGIWLQTSINVSIISINVSINWNEVLTFWWNYLEVRQSPTSATFCRSREYLDPIFRQFIKWIRDVIFWWLIENFDLYVALDEKVEITNVSKIHHLETFNICTKFHGNPSNSC